MKKRVLVLCCVFLLLCCSLPLSVFADVVGDSEYQTGWYLTCNMDLYLSEEDLSYSWGSGYDIPLVNPTDEYNNLSVSGDQYANDRMNYPDYDYSILAVPQDVAHYSLFPGFAGQNNVYLPHTLDYLDIFVSGSFTSDLGEMPYLRFSVNSVPYTIESYSISFDYWDPLTNTAKTYSETNNLFYSSELTACILPSGVSYVNNYRCILHIVSTGVSTGTKFKFFVDHSVYYVGTDPTYSQGWSDGYAAGYSVGYNAGYRAGKVDTEALKQAEIDILNANWEARMQVATEKAYARGVDDGVSQGLTPMNLVVSSLQAIWNFELIPGVLSLGGVFGIVIGIMLTLIFLKMFGGHS